MLLKPNKLLVNLLASGLFLSSTVEASVFTINTEIAANGKESTTGTLLKKNGATQNGKEQTWVNFSSKEGGFSVDFPKNPEHVHQKIDIPKTDLSIEYDTFVSEPSESVVYVVSVWNYPAEIDMSKPEVNLQDGFSGMLSALPGSQVLNMNMGDLQGFKALEFLVKNDEIYFQGKLILVYNTLYQVFTVYKESEKQNMTKNYRRFIDSFKILNPESHKVAPKNGKGSIKKMHV